MKTKLISFDADSVLLNTEDIIFDIINKIYHKRLKTMDVTDWDFYMRNYPIVFEYFNNPEFYDNVKPVEGMVEVLTKTILKYGAQNIQIVTSSSNNMKIGKEKALSRIFGHIPYWNKINIIHVGLKDDESSDIPHHKYEFSENTILIDDAIHNIDDHLNYNHYNKGLLIDFNYGWNQNYSHSRMIRIKKPEQILVELNNLINSEGRIL